MPAKPLPVANLADPAYRFTLMRETVRVLKEAAAAGADLHYPLLNLVAVFIDGLASGPRNGTRAAYLEYLTEHFPQLCAELGASTFYEAFRCKAVHEFGIKPGFAIARAGEMRGRYSDVLEAEGAGTHVALNIDRLVDDFLEHVRRRLDAAVDGSPTPSPEG